MKSSLLFFVGIILLFPFSAPANAALVPCSGRDCDFCDLFGLVHNVFDFITLTLTPAIAVVLFVASGLMLIASGASESLRQRGKDMLRGTIIGVVIVLLSFVIVNTTINVLTGLGVDSSASGTTPTGFPWPWNDPSCT